MLTDVYKRQVLTHTKCLSADVNCAFDPSFPDVAERRNIAYVNYGTVLTKYTGSRGKSGCNEATAEFMGFVRDLFDSEGSVSYTHLEVYKRQVQ